MDIPKKRITEDVKESNNDQAISETDSKIYDFLDKHLEEANTDSFSLGFAKKIIQKIESKQQRQLNIKIYGLISVLLLISIPLFISFLNTEFILMLSSVLLRHKFIFCFLISVVILIQFGEKLINHKKDVH